MSFKRPSWTIAAVIWIFYEITHWIDILVFNPRFYHFSWQWHVFFKHNPIQRMIMAWVTQILILQYNNFTVNSSCQRKQRVMFFFIQLPSPFLYHLESQPWKWCHPQFSGLPISVKLTKIIFRKHNQSLDF